MAARGSAVLIYDCGPSSPTSGKTSGGPRRRALCGRMVVRRNERGGKASRLAGRGFFLTLLHVAPETRFAGTEKRTWEDLATVRFMSAGFRRAVPRGQAQFREGGTAFVVSCPVWICQSCRRHAQRVDPSGFFRRGLPSRDMESPAIADHGTRGGCC